MVGSDIRKEEPIQMVKGMGILTSEVSGTRPCDFFSSRNHN